MGPDKDQYLKLVAKKREAQIKTSNDQHIKDKAEILAGKLAHDPQWRFFQEEVAEQIRQATVAINSYEMVLKDATTVSAEDMARAKIGFHAHQMKLDSFQYMLEFAAKIKKVDEDQAV